LSLKSDGKQFLLNIKPKYRKSVTPILKMLKENREASDFVCQAILEKVARDGITSIESQVEVLLEGNTDMLAPRKSSVNRISTFRTARTQVSTTAEEVEDKGKEQESEITTLPESKQEEEIEKVSQEELLSTQSDVQEQPSVSSMEQDTKPVKTIEESENKDSPQKEASITNPTVSKKSATPNGITATINGKDVQPKEETPKGLGNALFDMD
jgi:hypothetical protein